jgi:DNA-binding MarR family transcriptional regulator
MRRLLTGYAVSYNFRHRRHGHLFQNRYKSILCQEDSYLLVVARSLLCFWATAELAISQVELGRKLKISQPAVSMAVRRGKQLASRNSYSLKD